jgi:hypothetical protein
MEVVSVVGAFAVSLNIWHSDMQRSLTHCNHFRGTVRGPFIDKTI